MATKLETSTGRLDGLKWAAAILLLGGAIGAFYIYSDQLLLLRVIGLLAVSGIAAAILLQTEKGRQAREFAREARTEVRKVVWPTRKETLQVTALVIAMVSIAAVFLWLLDMLLGWVVRSVIGGGV
jgi:preprotein translocase subunit SecE